MGKSEESVLVEVGESSQASYSPTGDRLIFVSQKRLAHAQPQVYIKDLASGIERRVTFQIGALSAPRFSPKGDAIIYASSTDELKELPPHLSTMPSAKAMPRLPPNEPTDLYVHRLTDFQIERLTERPGFDGEARFSPDGKSLYWTRATQNRTQVLNAPATPHAHPHPVQGLGENPVSYTLSPDAHFASWIEYDKDFTHGRLKLKHGKDIVEVAADQAPTKTDNEFSPDSKWLLWAQKATDSESFELWGFDIEHNCLQRFRFSAEADRRHPTLSPDLKFLTYTQVTKGRSRILRAPFESRTAPCAPAP